MKRRLVFIVSIVFLLQNVHAQVTSLSENFTACTSGNVAASWVAYSVTGSDSWKCSTTGYIGTSAYMNGYSNSTNNANEDWLISPLLNFSAMTAPNLSFWTRNNYAGNQLQLYVSSNYAGSGNPNSATWTLVNVSSLPVANSNVWTLSNNINLTPYKSSPFRFAFKYTSTTTAAASWKVDEVNIIDGSMTSLSKKFLNVGQCNAGSQTSSQNFSFTMSAINGTFDVIVPPPFQISKDNTNFSTTLSYTNAAAGIPQNVYVRLAPTVVDKVYRKEIIFSYNGIPLNDKVNVLGTSMPDNSTLRVYSWNMRWFGSPTWCNCDTAIAKTNAIQILKDINADVYCLQEIVSNTQIAQIATALGPNYGYTVSPFCTGVTNPSSGFYQNCQKLGYIYNTNKIQNIGNFGLLSSTYPADTLPYYCFSSGRFPYMMKVVMNLNGGVKDTVVFANIHSKADNTLSDYNRRVCSVEKMTDSLLALFPNKKVMVIGDYNDYLEGTTVSGQTISPFQYLLNNGYSGISLPSLYTGQATFVGSTNHIIDNIVCSNSLKAKYLDSSFFIFTETNKYITDYGNSTSDHYPIMSYFRFNFPNSIKNIHHEAFELNIVNPSGNTLFIHNTSHEKFNRIAVVDITGKVVFEQKSVLTQTPLQLFIPNVQQGMYFVIAENEKGIVVKKWSVIE